MIVLSVGMPRAGSGWHYNLVNDLMKAAGAADARTIRARYHLEGILTEVNCNIGVLSARRLAMVSVPALLGNTFVIKAHAAPTAASRLLQKLGLLRITYIYRDPRDAMLSAYEYGKRSLTKGRPNAFSHLTGFQESLDFMLQYVHIWEQWMQERGVLVTRYEDLLLHYDAESARLAEFLKVDPGRPETRQVFETYRPEAAEAQQGLHFYKGRIGRFREGYTADQQAVLRQRFGAALARMRYEL
ncbi:MAG: sulfotransferase domain-containing protein [Bacteroidota bacterium]